MPVTWIYGNSGAGKTTLAKKLIASEPNQKTTIFLDGDIMRHCWFLGFNEADRRENNIRIALIARMFTEKGFSVYVATICPYEDLRREVQRITDCRFIKVEGGEEKTTDQNLGLKTPEQSPGAKGA